VAATLFSFHDVGASRSVLSTRSMGTTVQNLLARDLCTSAVESDQAKGLHIQTLGTVLKSEELLHSVLRK
jgi:hypothetical protein